MQKKIISLVCFLFIAIISSAQSPLHLAFQQILNKEKVYHLDQKDLLSFEISHENTSKKTGATTYYLQQTIDGIAIQNAMLVVTIDKRGNLVHVGNSSISHAYNLEKVANAIVPMDQAAVFAAENLGVLRPEKPSIIKRSNEAIGELSKTSYTRQSITVKPEYIFKENKLYLSHQLVMYMADSPDYWQINVSKNDGTVLQKFNYTLYCTHQKGAFKHDESCFQEKLSVDQTLRVENKRGVTATDGAKYKVYALPIESPNHGAQVLVEDPAFPEASPFGWHDTNGVLGPEFKTTKGNNAYAFADKNDDNIPDIDTPSPQGGDSLVFNFNNNLDLDPLSNANASITNLFYVTNMMHDISFLYGFDEESGNFQAKNYSGKGNGNDYVNANAFDGIGLSQPKLNNANFATPTDGNSGIMQMYLFNETAGSVNTVSPEEVGNIITDFGTADGFGPPIPQANETPVQGSLILAKDNSPSPTRVCRIADLDLTGKIALVDRGECDFSDKVYNVQRKGAIACIICNASGINSGSGDEILNMAAGDNADKVTIPSLFVRKSECDKLKNLIGKGTDIVLRLQSKESGGPTYIDGALDNTVITHEYAHGISTRLTGGPANSGCLGNTEQMGEGWSDFFALVTSVKEGDDGAFPRGIGTFVSGQPTSGGGIRRYPYSTDMTINPNTYNDIKGITDEHIVGEIWTSAIWDLYWAMAEAHGFDANIKNTGSGNGRAIQLVMEGMKIQGCNPGFIEGRDAIIAADYILFDGENNCLIWNVFARRGLGVYAQGGSTNSVDDGMEDFEPLPTCIEKLKVVKTLPEIATAGEAIPVKLNTVNHVKSDLKGVFVTDQLPEGGSFVSGSSNFPAQVDGNTIRFQLGDMAYEEEKEITYKILAPGLKSQTLLLYDIESNLNDFDIDITVGFDTWTVVDQGAKSGNSAFFIQGTLEANDHSLITPSIPVSGQKPAIRFFHKFDTEPVYDGGFVQISTDNGLFWQNIEDSEYLRNGPTNDISYSSIPIPGLRGFSGSSGGKYIDTYIDVSKFNNSNIKLKFRFATDTAVVVKDGGWYIDDIELMDLKSAGSIACINDELLDKENCTDEKVIIINSDVALKNKDLNIGNFDLQLAPNPANGSVNILINSNKKSEGKIMIRSLDGKLIKTLRPTIYAEKNTFNVDISDLEVGMYILEVVSAEHRLSKKLIVY